MRPQTLCAGGEGRPRAHEWHERHDRHRGRRVRLSTQNRRCRLPDNGFAGGGPSARACRLSVRNSTREAHLGAIDAAQRILAVCNASPLRDVQTLSARARKGEARLQDSYSIRCAPQVIGALFDGLAFAQKVLEVEINSVNDNPDVIHEEGLVLNGGHFYGSHVALACDMLKPAVANVAALLDRNLQSWSTDVFQTGFQTTSRCAHAWRALKRPPRAQSGSDLHERRGRRGAARLLPASVFSRPTECLNQDVVSLGTIAARDLARVVDRSQWAVAIMGFALRQAAHVTPDEGFYARLTEQGRTFLDALCAECEPVTEDRGA